MPPPTPLAIATSAVNRLVKEEAYYHKEQASQEKRIQKLEADLAANAADLDSNAEYMLKQEKTALDETKAVFEPLRRRIAVAVDKLEEEIAILESDGTGAAEELTNGREALKAGQDLVAAREKEGEEGKGEGEGEKEEL